MLLGAAPAFAAVNVQDIGTLVNGATSATVDAGETFDLTFTADATLGDEIEYVRTRARDENNHILSTTCTNVGRKTGDDVEMTAQSSTPSDTPQNNIDVLIDVYGNPGVSQHNGCTGSSLDNFIFQNIVRVGDNSTDGQSNGNGNGGSNTGSTPAWQSAIDALTSKLNSLTDAMTKLAELVKGGSTTTPAQGAICAQLPPSSNVTGLQSFLMMNGQAPTFSASGVYAPTGYLGPITLQALANFKYANHCI